MANQRHLKKLNEGVIAWNKWRNERPEILPDLREAPLHGKTLTSIDFRHTNLDFADLEPIPIGSTISGFQATRSQRERSGFKITGKAVHLSGSRFADQRCKEIWICQ